MADSGFTWWGFTCPDKTMGFNKGPFGLQQPQHMWGARPLGPGVWVVLFLF